MGMMINRRRACGGEKLPQGAVRIEYLESSGTQYIDTGIIPYRGFEATIDFQYTSLANNQSLFGCWNISSRTIYMVCLYQSAWYFGSYSTSNQDHVQWKDNVIDMKRHTISIDGNGSISQDGVLLQTTSNMSNSNIGASVYVFARNLRIEMACSRIRCYSFKMKDNNNTLILELIPVRIGQTGYMYDKVTKQLFGNVGTGHFILGPDKRIVVGNPVNVNAKTHNTGSSNASLDIITEDGEPVNIFYSDFINRYWTNGYIQVEYDLSISSWALFAVTPCLYDGQVYQVGDLIATWVYTETKDITIIANYEEIL